MSTSPRDLAERYTHLEVQCGYDTRRPDPDEHILFSEVSHRLQTFTVQHVLEHMRSAKTTDRKWKAAVDIAIRFILGAEGRQHNPYADAECALQIALNEQVIGTSSHPVSPSRALLVKARALAAHAYLAKYHASTRNRAAWAGSAAGSSSAPTITGSTAALTSTAAVLSDLGYALYYAYMNAEADFLPRAVFEPFVALRTLAGQLEVDLTRYKFWRRFAPLLKYYEQRTLLAILEDQTYPPRYGLPRACEAEGCKWNMIPRKGAAAASGLALVACDGGCEMAKKPTYCSERCRSVHQPRHARVCRPGQAFESKPPAIIVVGPLTARLLEKVLAKID
ncbi:hypothetical protein C8Q80DRAFT_1125453 [Daedaleopsis nitida]|nr:hypothetical protein C8Q80DRAFT_1125453 [Daedaleopsis nitida]